MKELVAVFGFVMVMVMGVVIARSPLEDEVRKVVEGERPNPAPESVCMAQFQVNANTIIRTKDSRSQGAKYLNETELPSKGDCLLWCCQVTSCNVAVFEEKDRGSCYLFDCGSHSDFKCTFTSHNQYTSAVLDTTQRRPVTKWKPSDEHIEALKSLKSESVEDYTQQTNQPIAAITTQVPGVFLPNQPPTNLPSTPHSTPERRCSQFQFECRTNSECIAIYNACDGIPQCSDGSDESNDLGCPPAGRRWLGPPEPPAPSSAFGGPFTTGSDQNFADHAQVGGWQEREAMTPSANSNIENNDHVRNLFYPHAANQRASGIVDSNESGHREANSRSRPLADVQEANRPGKSHSRSSFNEGSSRWNSDVRPSPPPPLPPPPPPPKHDSAAIVQSAADVVDDSNRGRPRYHNAPLHESTDGYNSWQQQNHGSQRHNNAGSVFTHKSNNLPDGSVSLRSRPGSMLKVHQVADDNENNRGYFDNGYDSAPRVDDSDTHYNGIGGIDNQAREYYEADFPTQKKPNPQPVPVPHYSDEYLQRQDGAKNSWPKLSGNEEYKVPSGSYRDYPENVANDNKSQQKHFQPPGRLISPHGNSQWTNGKDRNNDYGKPNGDPEAMTRDMWQKDSSPHLEPVNKGLGESGKWKANHQENFIDNDQSHLASVPEAGSETELKQHAAEHAAQKEAAFVPKGNTSVIAKDKGNSVTEVTSSTAHVLPQAQPRLSHSEVNSAQMESEDGDKSPQSSGAAVLALTLGLSVTGLLLVLVGCRLRRVRRRMMRRGRSPYAHDADYLVNGMYL